MYLCNRAGTAPERLPSPLAREGTGLTGGPTPAGLSLGVQYVTHREKPSDIQALVLSLPVFSFPQEPNIHHLSGKSHAHSTTLSFLGFQSTRWTPVRLFSPFGSESLPVSNLPNPHSRELCASRLFALPWLENNLQPVVMNIRQPDTPWSKEQPGLCGGKQALRKRGKRRTSVIISAIHLLEDPKLATSQFVFFLYCSWVMSCFL